MKYFEAKLDGFFSNSIDTNSGIFFGVNNIGVVECLADNTEWDAGTVVEVVLGRAKIYDFVKFLIWTNNILPWSWGSINSFLGPP